jgi:hypothetical protein
MLALLSHGLVDSWFCLLLYAALLVMISFLVSLALLLGLE